MDNLALFIPDLRCGGAERVLLTLAEEFSQRSSVDLIVARGEGEFLKQVPGTVRLIDLDVGLRGLGHLGLALGATIGLYCYLRREKPVALLSTLTGANLVAIVAKILSFSNVKLVVREASTLQNVKGMWRKKLMRWLYSKADMIVVLTEEMQRGLIDEIGIESESIVRIANPINVESVKRLADRELTHPWFQKDNPPVIISVGRLCSPKDFATLLKAFSRVRRETEARLVILGEGEDRWKLESLARELAIEEFVIIAGFEENPFRWMKRASVFVLSTYWEGSPNVLFESIALEKPVVLTEYDKSAREYAKCDCVTLVPVEDSDAMAQAILKYLDEDCMRPICTMPSEIENSSNLYIEQLLG